MLFVNFEEWGLGVCVCGGGGGGGLRSEASNNSSDFHIH